MGLLLNTLRRETHASYVTYTLLSNLRLSNPCYIWLQAVLVPADVRLPLQVTRQSVVHLPDEQGWAELMQPLHDALDTSTICTDRLPQLNQVCIPCTSRAGNCSREYTLPCSTF